MTFLAMVAQPAWADDNEAFSMLIHRGLSKSENETLIFGSIKTGEVVVGDTVCVPLTNGEFVSRKIIGISMFSTVKKRAEAGNTVGLSVENLKPAQIAQRATLRRDCGLSALNTEAEAAVEAAPEKSPKEAAEIPAQPALDGDKEPYLMQIYDAFGITGRGTVIFGLIKSGAVKVGDTACVPMTNGETIPRTVTAIERSRKILDKAEEGQTVGLLVPELKSSLVAKGEILDGNCKAPASDSEMEKAPD
jgi:GTPase